MDNSEAKLSKIDFVVFVCSFLFIVLFTIELVFNLDDNTKFIIEISDILICTVFLYDFFYRFAKAGNKLNFIKWGWIDLVSSIPMIEPLRVGRLFRLMKLIRMIRLFRSSKNLLDMFFKKKSVKLIYTVGIFAVILVLFSTIAILQVETDAQSNIKTVEDAVWWSVSTITTVGYGDRFPVTTEGRIIAMLLMVYGVGLFGTFAGFVVAFFTGNRITENE